MIDKFDVFKDESNGCFQLRSKTNAYVLEFDDCEKEEIFLRIVNEIQQNKTVSLKKLNGLFDESRKAKVTEVLSSLSEHGFLPYEIANELSNGEYSEGVGFESSLKKVHLGIIGEGDLLEELSLKAEHVGFSKVSKFYYSKNRDEKSIEKIITDVDFLIVDANRWSPYHLKVINRIALAKNKAWLHVGGLEETSLKLGPLFYGKETGCYNCLISRIKSNHEYPEMLTSYEEHLSVTGNCSRPDLFPNLNILYSLAVDFVLLEVAKFYEEWSLPLTWRSVLAFDIISYRMTQHNLLKKPFCEECKPELEYNSSPWLEAITLK